MDHFVTGVEFGDEKICVIHANVTEDGNVNVLSFVTKPSKGAIYKGEIININSVYEILKDALDESEKTLPHTLDRGEQHVYCLMNDHRIVSKQASATIQITSPQKKITQKDINEVTRRAEENIILADMEQIAIFDGCFYLNEYLRETGLLGKIADTLTAQPHIVFAPKSQMDLIRRVFDELGFEQPVSPLFSPIAASFAALTRDERDRGALLIDFGYGVCSYAFIYKDGFLLSGSIPVGVCNVINDLSLGLDLPFDFCHTFIKEGRLTALHESKQNFVEYQEANKMRKIPLYSFERIIDLRVQEIFTYLLEAMQKNDLLNEAPDTTLVLTGGGSLISGVVRNMQSVFQLPYRIGSPLKTTGIDVAADRPAACCTAILGLVREVDEFKYETRNGNPMTEFFSELGGKVINVLKSIG